MGLLLSVQTEELFYCDCQHNVYSWQQIALSSTALTYLMGWSCIAVLGLSAPLCSNFFWYMVAVAQLNPPSASLSPSWLKSAELVLSWLLHWVCDWTVWFVLSPFKAARVTLLKLTDSYWSWLLLFSVSKRTAYTLFTLRNWNETSADRREIYEAQNETLVEAPPGLLML